jgi:hypothetical protein
MQLTKALALACLLVLAAASHGQTRAGSNECPAGAPFLSVEALKKAGVEFPLFKRYCFADKSGSYALLLGEEQDRRFPEEPLSSAIQASLYKVGSDHMLTRQWAIRDFAGEQAVGVNFRTRLFEFTDIDGDALVDPVLVYRFFESEGDDHVNLDPFSGRAKIIAFHQGRKATIHAVTGQLDGQRRTTGNSGYFALPKTVQRHLVKKMGAMYSARQFGFDNSYGFAPQKEPAGR